MKKPYRGYSMVIGTQLISGIEPGDLVSIYRVTQRTGKDTMTYSASVEWLHTTMARKHQRENPTGKKRRKQLFSSSEEEVRLEKDMIAVAKFAIKRGAISSPVFVDLATLAFKQAANLIASTNQHHHED